MSGVKIMSVLILQVVIAANRPLPAIAQQSGMFDKLLPGETVIKGTQTPSPLTRSANTPKQSAPLPGQLQLSTKTNLPTSKTQNPAPVAPVNQRGNGGMLDNIDDTKLGPVTISGTQQRQLSTAPSVTSNEPLTIVMKEVLREGLRISPPSNPGSDGYKAMVELAKQCGLAEDKLSDLMNGMQRSVTVSESTLAFKTGKKQARVLTIAVPPSQQPQSRLPDCLTSSNAGQRLQLEVLEKGNESDILGVVNAIQLQQDAIGAVAKQINNALRDGGKKWRLATAQEFAAIMPALFDRDLYSAQSDQAYWTSTDTSDGRRVMVIPGIGANNDYSFEFALSDAKTKGKPLWLR